MSVSIGSNKNRNTCFKVIYLRHNTVHASRSSHGFFFAIANIYKTM